MSARGARAAGRTAAPGGERPGAAVAPGTMQRAGGGGAPGGSGGGPGTAFSIDSLIGPPPPRSGHLLYTGYPMFMPYRPLVLPQALAPAPLPAGLPPLAPLASFAGRLTNTFCAGLGQAVPSMVALTTALPSFAEPPDAFYGPQELAAAAAATAARNNPEPGGRRPEGGLEAEELMPGREKVAEPPPPPPPHFSETFPSLPGKCWGRPGRRAGGSFTWKSQTAARSESRHLPGPWTPRPPAAGFRRATSSCVPNTAPLEPRAAALLSPRAPEASAGLPSTPFPLSAFSPSTPSLKPWPPCLFLRIPSFPSSAESRGAAAVGLLGTLARPQGKGTLGQLSVQSGEGSSALTPDGLCDVGAKGGS